jgi:RimJ/RimL family protein N-acetyltransferase
MTTASPAPAGLTVRTITEQELELFFALPLDYDDGALRAPTTLDSFTTEWRRGSRRPGWTWLALRHGRPVARAAWWAPSESAHPAILDIFDLGAEPDRLAVGEALLRACWREASGDGAAPDLEYELFLPPGWRGDPAAREPAERRLEVARRAGLAVLVERLRYQWFPAAGLPPRGDRLRLRPLAEVGEGAFLDALARTYSGSLDAHTRQELDRGVPPEQIARDDLALLRQLPGPSEWWRLADDRDGRLVGVAVPGGNDNGHIVAYLGVVPEQRGHGYAGELLAEATAFLAEQGTARIRADTDVANTPMAAAFERAGYDQFAIRIDLVAGPVT